MLVFSCCGSFQQVSPDAENGDGIPNSFIISVQSCDFKNMFEKNGTINMFNLYTPNSQTRILPALILIAFSNDLSAEDRDCFRNMCHDFGKKSKGKGILNGIILQVMYTWKSKACFTFVAPFQIKFK